MSAALAQPDPAALPAATPGDAKYIAILDRLLASGETLVAELLAEDVPATEKAIPFERIAAAIRRTIALARHIIANQPDPAKIIADVAEAKATAARRRIARTIDDKITRTTTTAGDANALRAELRAELRERLDDPALDLDLANRTVESVIAELCRDLGLANTESHIWPRRTPADARAIYTDAQNLDDDEPLPATVATLIRRRSVADG